MPSWDQLSPMLGRRTCSSQSLDGDADGLATPGSEGRRQRSQPCSVLAACTILSIAGFFVVSSRLPQAVGEEFPAYCGALPEGREGELHEADQAS